MASVEGAELGAGGGPFGATGSQCCDVEGTAQGEGAAFAATDELGGGRVENGEGAVGAPAAMTKLCSHEEAAAEAVWRCGANMLLDPWGKDGMTSSGGRGTPLWPCSTRTRNRCSSAANSALAISMSVTVAWERSHR